MFVLQSLILYCVECTQWTLQAERGKGKGERGKERQCILPRTETSTTFVVTVRG